MASGLHLSADYLLGSLKITDVEVDMAVRKWLRMQESNFTAMDCQILSRCSGIMFQNNDTWVEKVSYNVITSVLILMT
jgi:hypothetical protein